MKAKSQFMHFRILLCKKILLEALWLKSPDLRVTGRQDIQDFKSDHQPWSFASIPCSSLEIHFFEQFQKDLPTILHKVWTAKVEEWPRMPNEDSTKSSCITAMHRQHYIAHMPMHKGWNFHLDLPLAVLVTHLDHN
mgnify:CR=1 FL=1